MGMRNGKTICDKHDDIDDLANQIIKLVSAAKSDGQDMENGLDEKREKIRELENLVSYLTEERDNLKDELATLKLKLEELEQSNG